MSHLVNLSDEVYEELTKMKKVRNTSYSEVIRSLFPEQNSNKTCSWDDMIAKAKKRDAKFSGKTEQVDHDLIAYGVSRARS